MAFETLFAIQEICSFQVTCSSNTTRPRKFAQLRLIQHVYNNAERRNRATIVCFFEKNITRRVCRCFHAEATLAYIVAVSSMQTGATLLHYASPITEQLLLGNSKLNKHFLVKQGSYGTMKKSWNFINLVQEF